ncbi:hypothetical protein Y1Q_0010214 [Alligator mississippiensis]|uniref:Uncharacterized protein n=1 Tax=Alligator mississippiensis TaxID=8496 RepID=A0A151NG60_ALLMI|nr:hypothetical protein Y1Q_0010214 [Alligator mississippiensis]
MIVATVLSLLVFQYIIRNRANNPRLHDMLLRMAGLEVREHISTPEDAETASGVEDRGGEGLSGTAASAAPVVEASAEGSSAPSAMTQETPSAPEVAVEDAPVEVTITVTTTS